MQVFQLAIEGFAVVGAIAIVLAAVIAACVTVGVLITGALNIFDHME